VDGRGGFGRVRGASRPPPLDRTARPPDRSVRGPPGKQGSGEQNQPGHHLRRLRRSRGPDCDWRTCSSDSDSTPGWATVAFSRTGWSDSPNSAPCHSACASAAFRRGTRATLLGRSRVPFQRWVGRDSSSLCPSRAHGARQVATLLTQLAKRGLYSGRDSTKLMTSPRTASKATVASAWIVRQAPGQSVTGNGMPSAR